MEAARRPPEGSPPEEQPEVDRLKREVERLQERVRALEHEKADACRRLEFVEELVGPTEAQRKTFQDQAVNARAAALRAHRSGAGVPVRLVGRLDEARLRGLGLSERDVALLQRGCVTGADGVPRDVSLLGDPAFRPFDEVTKAPRWEARGGALRLSLGDVRDRWGEAVALEVVRCAQELDAHDASRRLGMELPWSEAEGRELEAAEVIDILERELAETKRVHRGRRSGDRSAQLAGGIRLEGEEDMDSEAIWSADTRSRILAGEEDGDSDSEDTSTDDLSGSSAQEVGIIAGSWSATGGVNFALYGHDIDGTVSASGASLQELPDSDDGASNGQRSFGDAGEVEEIDCLTGDGDSDVAGQEWGPVMRLLEPVGATVAADADIQRILQQPEAADGKVSRDPTKSITATPRTAGERTPGMRQELAPDDENADGGDEGFADVLRELLEGEVAESIGRWLAPTALP